MGARVSYKSTINSIYNLYLRSSEKIPLLNNFLTPPIERRTVREAIDERTAYEASERQEGEGEGRDGKRGE